MGGAGSAPGGPCRAVPCRALPCPPTPCPRCGAYQYIYHTEAPKLLTMEVILSHLLTAPWTSDRPSLAQLSSARTFGFISCV